MNSNFKSFTLIELIVVVIILGILAAIAIPMYTGTVEQRKGEACINNMRTILAAWRIYNIREETDFFPDGVPEGEPVEEWLTLPEINQRFNTFIDEKNFGSGGEEIFAFTAGGMGIDSENITLETFRIAGPYQSKGIRCAYHYKRTSGVIYDWEGNWPWLPEDESI